MTDIEFRQQAFIDAYNALVARYGFVLVARTVPADTPVPVTPPIIVVAVADWKAPDAGTAATDEAQPALVPVPNGKVTA